MKKNIIFVLFLFFIPGMLLAQTGAYYSTYSHRKCDLTALQDANTSVTFYGDSRGDFVDDPLYGANANGWSTYLNFGAVRPWNVQNLAIKAHRIRNMYNLIVNCTFDSESPNSLYPNYITATRYAFEIGGNMPLIICLTSFLLHGIFKKAQIK